MKTLKEQRLELIKYIKSHDAFIKENKVKEDIYSGNLLPYIEKVLKDTLSPSYYDKIKERIIPINVYPRVIDKISKVYAYGVSRKTDDKYKEVLEFYEKKFKIDTKMMYADRYANMFKGYSMEPFYDDFSNDVKLRVSPFDRFLVYSSNPNDSLDANIFIKFMGKRKVSGDKEKRIFYTYSNEEFDAFDEDGHSYMAALEGNEGVNPYGVIPQVYGNRDANKLIPTQDTDIVAMTKMIPVLMTDLAGAIMFQCFSIIYMINAEESNFELNPNALWIINVDPKSEKETKIGTIKPEADIDKVLNYIKNVFAFWLETKGIKAGSIGELNGANMASGISKVIDEMDVSELRRENSKYFKADEELFWSKMIHIHNAWVDAGYVNGMPKLGDDFVVEITYGDPEPLVNEDAILDREIKKLDKSLTTKERALQRIEPDISDDIIKEIINNGETKNEQEQKPGQEREEEHGTPRAS